MPEDVLVLNVVPPPGPVLAGEEVLDCGAVLVVGRIVDVEEAVEVVVVLETPRGAAWVVTTEGVVARAGGLESAAGRATRVETRLWRLGRTRAVGVRLL